MNENKFDRKGDVYVKARPTYPEALFWYLLSERIIDKQSVAADIGAGTGIFTKQLSDFVKHIYAIEPNDDMRLEAEKSFANIQNITLLNASAENTALEEKSVDIITVAQAFHWFNRAIFKEECKRIIKGNGKVVLVWNDRDATSDIIRDNYDINKKYCPNFKGASNGINFDKDAFSDFFEGEFEIVEFENSTIYDLDTFIARNLSSSYAPTPKDEHYDSYIRDLTKVFDRHCCNGTVKYPYITRCYIGKVW